MKFDVSDSIPPLQPSSPPDLNLKNQTTLASPAEVNPPPRNAFRASLAYLAAAVIALLGELYLAFESRAWQVFAVAGIGAILTGVAAYSLRLVRRERPRLAIWLLIGASLAAVLAAPFLVSGFGLVLGLGTILVVLNIALQTLPQKEANWALMASVAAAILAGGLELVAPASQLTLPAFQILILILGGGIILLYGLMTVRQFRTYPLTTKLILAFLAVSLIPLGVLAFFNYRHTRIVLFDQAQQSLFAAASKTVADIDTFIKDHLDIIRTEAQLPVLAAYLNLPPAQRSDSGEGAGVRATLQELSRKDKVFITSYALLDRQGKNLIDTLPPNIDQDESTHSYFQKPLETGLPYVSPVELSTAVAEDRPKIADQAALYFSSPVRDPVTQEIIGVLRARYKTSILQRLVVQNNGLVGEQSFAMLFDENYIRLAHGAAPELIFQPAAPLDPNQTARLQAAGRLPGRSWAGSASDLPELVTGLENAIFEPYFTTRLIHSGDLLNLVVAKELETQPWLVIFAQPQDLFLTPIQAQTRATLFLGIIIAGCVAAMAFAMGQLLANPLVDLARIVTQFTEGNLDARASLKSGDESGLLAASFNKMAEQVGNLLRSLAERTRQLELEVDERQRAEIGLQASEEKYRRLFEDSRDVIFITAAHGQITDINPRGVNLFGYSRPQLKQMNILDLYLDPTLRPKFQQEIERRGSVRDFEIQFVREDREIRDCLITATLRKANDGAILGYQGIIRDITEQKQIEKEHLRLLAIERELTLAQEIQQSLLPSPQPTWNGPDLVCYSSPAREMGGDLYAYHAFDGRRFAIVVGDVSGKGMPAALLMAVSLASFQTIVRQGLPPPELLAHLDQAITPYTRETGQNCALIYGEMTLPYLAQPTPPPGTTGGILRVVNAGCMIPLVRPRAGPVRWVEAFGTPLGTVLSAEFGYQEFEVPLAKGDLIILTSDGVVEANNAAHEMFGFERLEQAVAGGPTHSAEAMLEHLKAAVAAFVGKTEPHDDLTMVVVQV